MKPLTLEDIERELIDLADSADRWDGVESGRLRDLARRIAVQLISAGEAA